MISTIPRRCPPVMWGSSGLRSSSFTNSILIHPLHFISIIDEGSSTLFTWSCHNKLTLPYFHLWAPSTYVGTTVVNRPREIIILIGIVTILLNKNSFSLISATSHPSMASITS
jgi:hypothetical protein